MANAYLPISQRGWRSAKRTSSMASAIVIILPTIRIERCDDEQDGIPQPADVIGFNDARMRREFNALREACERRPCDCDGDAENG